MVSIKRYLSNSADETALRQALALLIQKTGECAVEGDPRELETFREEMNAVQYALGGDLPPENLLTLAHSAAKALETYNRQITRAIGKQSSDFQTIIRMFRDSLIKIAGENVESVQSLSKIGEELERGAGFTDLQSLKQHLGDCLTSLREAIERDRSGSKALIEKLQIEIETFRGPAAALTRRKVDSTTGLPRQKDCLVAIQEAIERGTRHYAVVMVVNRVQPINARFGMDAGDRMLARFKEYVETQLHGSDRLFRWIGPAMVAVVERAQALDQVCVLMKRMLDAPIQENYDIGGRSVLIPISAAWSVITLNSTSEAAEKQIQTFVASQGCRDFA